MSTPTSCTIAAPDPHDLAGQLMAVAATSDRPGAVVDALLSLTTDRPGALDLALDVVEVLARTTAHLATAPGQ